MSLLSWLVALAVLLVIVIKAVVFYRATACRQMAWLKSTELVTRSLLPNPKPIEREWHLGCRLHLVREQDQANWQRLPSMKKHTFFVQLKGEL